MTASRALTFGVVAGESSGDNLGAALIAMGRIDAGIDQFRKAVALAPHSAIPRYNLGHALLTRGDLDEAVGVLSSAVEMDPASVQGRYELGNALLAARRYEEAARHYREVIRLSPRFAEATLKDKDGACRSGGVAC